MNQFINVVSLGGAIQDILRSYTCDCGSGYSIIGSERNSESLWTVFIQCPQCGDEQQFTVVGK